jgi:hypothetical protein
MHLVSQLNPRPSMDVLDAEFLPGACPRAIPILPGTLRHAHGSAIVGFGEDTFEVATSESEPPTEFERGEKEDVDGGHLPFAMREAEFVPLAQVEALLTEFYKMPIDSCDAGVYPCHVGIKEMVKAMKQHNIPLGCRTPDSPLKPGLNTKEKLEAAEDAKRALTDWSWTHLPCGKAECDIGTTEQVFKLSPFEVASVIDKAALTTVDVTSLVVVPFGVQDPDQEAPPVRPDTSNRLSLFSVVPSLSSLFPTCHHRVVEASLLSTAFGSEDWKAAMKFNVLNPVQRSSHGV